MKVVIDIPDRSYNMMKIFLAKGMGSDAIDYILNGTPLPKGHGRLIDADSMWNAYHDLDYDFYEAFDLVDTIIEADEESGDEG